MLLWIMPLIIKSRVPQLLVKSTVPTYHFHEISRVLSNPSRHYGEGRWGLISEYTEGEELTEVLAR